MIDMGEANIILGMKITGVNGGICLDQHHYIETLLEKYNYFDCKPVCTLFYNIVSCILM